MQPARQAAAKFGWIVEPDAPGAWAENQIHRLLPARGDVLPGHDVTGFLGWIRSRIRQAANRTLAKPLLLGLGFLATPGPLFPQVKDNGPAGVIITYKCKPETRAAFRAFMESDGVRHFAAWQRQGVFVEHRLFFSSFAAQGVGDFDLVAILDFSSFTAIARWQEIERQMPGGLPPEVLALAVPARTTLVYPVCQSGKVERSASEAACVLGLYVSLVENDAYERYVKGYIEPQLNGWRAAGVLSAYKMYQHHPYQEDLTEIPWTSLLVLEYTNPDALAGSEQAKSALRRKLAADPAWLAFSDIKNTIRKAKGFVFVEAIKTTSATGE